MDEKEFEVKLKLNTIAFGIATAGTAYFWVYQQYFLGFCLAVMYLCGQAVSADHRLA